MLDFKKIADNIKTNIKDNIKKIIAKIKENLTEEYFDLAPTDKIENGKEYLKALLWAIKNKRVKNIALTGPYGSGKSSIISAFLKGHKQIKKHTIRISMSTFCELKEEQIINIHQKDDGSTTKGVNSEVKSNNNRSSHIVKNIIDVDENIIEEGILKQLFYKVSYKDIPQSRFRKIHKVNFWSTFLYINLVVAFLLIITFIFFNNFFTTLLNQIHDAGVFFYNIFKTLVKQFIDINVFLNNDIITLIIAVTIIELCCTILALAWRRLFHKIKFNEIKIGENAVKTNEEPNNSAFNKYMDEIIYFFEETGCRLVFFEDLDRFKSTEIFIKLRELNTILNNCDFIKHKITFVYAVKDDIFTEDDRTKFFDFIVPVIPIVNSTNSGDVLIKLFKAQENKELKNYLLDVSPYISDMRMIYNIYNEFIFYKRINLSDLDDIKMLSLIIFKNLCPKDFADLQMEKGIVKDAFIHKDNFVKEKRTSLQNENKSLQKRLDNINEDYLKSVKEVKIAFLNEITYFKGQAYEINVFNGLDLSAEKFLDDDFDLENGIYMIPDECRVSYVNYKGNMENLTFSGFKDKYSHFMERVKLQKERNLLDINKLNSEIRQNREKERILSIQSFKQLIEDYDADNVLKEQVRENELLTFMLRRGYIDEDYFNYINDFKGVTITKNDMNFILAVKNHKPKPFDYKLDDPKEVIVRLQNYEFNSRAIYNFDIMNCLLSSEKYKYKLNEIIKSLKRADPNCVSFIVKYVNSFLSEMPNDFLFPYYKERLPVYLNYHIEEMFDKCREFCNTNATLLKPLFNQSIGLFKEVHFSDNYSTTEKIIFCTSFLYCSDINTIEKANINDSISEFIQNSAFILNGLSMLKNDKIIEILKVINISFNSFSLFDVNDKNNELIEYIIYSCMYRINSNTIGFIVNYKNPLLYSDLKYKNYTTIKKLNYRPLIDYIDCNFSDYIENVFLLPQNTQESKKTVIYVLEQLKSNTSLCQKVINHENAVIGCFPTLKKSYIKNNQRDVNDIWNELLFQKKIKCSWHNIYTYWTNFGFTKELNSYVSQNRDNLKKSKFSAGKFRFVLEFIKSDIFDSIIDELLPSLNLKCHSLSNIKTNIDSDLLRKMIVNNMIYKNEENLNFIRESYPDLIRDLEDEDERDT